MSEVVRAALSAVVEGQSLTLDQARDAMGAVMDGEATPAQLAALLVALRMRGETIEELAGFATAMRDRVVRVEAPPCCQARQPRRHVQLGLGRRPRGSRRAHRPRRTISR